MHPDFKARSNYFRNLDFKQARYFVNNEIGMGTDYVPEYLTFTPSMFNNFGPRSYNNVAPGAANSMAYRGTNNYY